MNQRKRLMMLVALIIMIILVSGCQESTSSKYERANKLLTEGKYTEAATIFDEISTYEDASKMSLYTKAINAAETGDFETAFSTFASLGEFKDCPMMITYYKGRQNETSVYDGAWIYGNKWFDAIEIYESIPLFRDSKDRAESCRKAAYDQAIKSGDEGDTSFAISVLKKLGMYSDAAKQVTYYQAIALLNQSDYSGAIRIFSTIQGFRDADSRASSSLEDGYNTAATMEEAGELDKANAIYLNLGDYKDSAERAYKLYYDAGMIKREAKDWDGARTAFTKAGEYSDATEQIKETTYQQASDLEASGDQQGAYRLFTMLGEYKDSFERANKPYYKLGIVKRDAQEWDAARVAFEHAETYSDAKEQIKETTYQEASALEASGDQEGAYLLFISLGEYKDSFERANKPYYELGIAKRDTQEWEASRTAFEHAGEYRDAVDQVYATYYAEGKAKRDAQDWEGAIFAFTAAGGYSDAANQILATRYAEGIAKRDARDWGGAISAFTSAEEYSDSIEQIKETYYQKAKALTDNDEYESAVSIYLDISSYKDVDNILKDNKNLAAVVARIPFTKKGNIVTFGQYEQDNNTQNGKEPIEWYILDVNEGKSLLLCKYGLEVLPYDSTSNSTWSNCDLREWLNGNFLNSGFSVLEKEAILLTNIDNHFESLFVNNETTTKDKIFILSESEFWDLAFSQRVNQCVCTPYAVARGGRQYTEDGKQMGYWWLRIPSTSDTVTFVGQYGVLGNAYMPKRRNNICVRPALWIELNADFFTSGEQ